MFFMFFSFNISIILDIDECTGSNPCDENANCNNTVGSFTCACNVGYVGNGFNCLGMIFDPTNLFDK